MNNERTITICGKSVKMRYCAAAETGYERMSGNKVDVFVPTSGKDDNGNDVLKPAIATTHDYLTLAFAAIIAAYSRNNENTPITIEDILYDATPTEVVELLTAVVQLRLEWYNVPSVVKSEIKKDEKGKHSKNAQAPTTSSKK